GWLVDGRMDDSVLRKNDLDGMEQALVLHDSRIDHGRELRHDVSPAVRERVPYAAQLWTIVGARQINDELIALHPASDMSLHVLATLGIVVDEHVGRVFPVRPPGHLGTEALLGLIDVVVDSSTNGIGAPLPDEAFQPFHAVLYRSDHGCKVAGERRK